MILYVVKLLLAILSKPIQFIGKSAKYLVSGVLGITLLTTASHLPVYYVSGGIANAVISKILKNTIRQPRPKNSRKPGHGMPSSHAQSLFYFVMISSCCLLRYDFSLITLILTIGLIFYASVATYWRIASELHTLNQTIVGAVLGATIGYIVFSLEGNIQSRVAQILELKANQPIEVPLSTRLIVVFLGWIVVYLVKSHKIDL